MFFGYRYAIHNRFYLLSALQAAVSLTVFAVMLLAADWTRTVQFLEGKTMATATSDDFLSGQGVPVDLHDIETELERLWAPAAEEVGESGAGHANVTRIVLSNLVVATRAANCARLEGGPHGLDPPPQPHHRLAAYRRRRPRRPRRRSPRSATSPRRAFRRSARSGSCSARVRKR